MTTAPVALYSDAWRGRYAQSNQYLKYLSADGLKERYVHLLDNIVKFTPAGKPHLDGLAADTGWTQRAADLWAESELRRLPALWLRDVEQMILDRPYANVKRALEVWGNRPNYQFGLSIIKYGRRDHMKDLLERGRLLMTPASNYDDPSLNPAIRDKELEFNFNLPPGTGIAVEIDKVQRTFRNCPSRARSPKPIAATTTMPSVCPTDLSRARSMTSAMTPVYSSMTGTSYLSL